MPPLDQIQKQVKAFFQALSGKQKAFLLVAVMLAVAVFGIFATMIGAPDYKPLVTGMEPADVQGLTSKLSAKNIQFRIGGDGKSVEVPSDKLDASRMEIASDGMPRSGRLGFELFDKMNWGQTEFDERVNYQRALEGELERSIQTLQNVESARVHLVLSTQSVFLDRERAAKATVVLKLRSGRLPEDTQLSIARLVSGAVDDLSPDNVTVIDADTNRPMGVAKRDPVSGDGTLETELTARLLHTLEPIVGPDHLRASVNVEYDTTSSEENEESYDPNGKVAVSEQHSEEQIGSATAGGVPGTSSNVPNAAAAPKPAVTSTDGMQISKSESSTFAVSKTVRHTVSPAGRIRKVSAALVVDDASETTVANGKETRIRRKRTADELKEIADLATASIGADVQRGDSVTVENIAFEIPEEKATPKPQLTDRVKVILHDWSMLVRYGALILLFLLTYVLLLRPVKKQVLSTFKQLPGRTSGQPGAIGSGADLDVSLAPDQRALILQKELLEKAKVEPTATAHLIQSWINEEAK